MPYISAANKEDIQKIYLLLGPKVRKNYSASLIKILKRKLLSFIYLECLEYLGQLCLLNLTDVLKI